MSGEKTNAGLYFRQKRDPSISKSDSTLGRNLGTGKNRAVHRMSHFVCHESRETSISSGKKPAWESKGVAQPDRSAGHAPSSTAPWGWKTGAGNGEQKRCRILKMPKKLADPGGWAKEWGKLI